MRLEGEKARQRRKSDLLRDPERLAKTLEGLADELPLECSYTANVLRNIARDARG